MATGNQTGGHCSGSSEKLKTEKPNWKSAYQKQWGKTKCCNLWTCVWTMHRRVV